jgi:hypothetical protein
MVMEEEENAELVAQELEKLEELEDVELKEVLDVDVLDVDPLRATFHQWLSRIGDL